MAAHRKRPVREVVGYFHTADKLFAAISDLEGAGFDRADLSLLARESFVESDHLSDYDDTHQAESDPHAKRQSVVADTDIRQVRTMVTSLAGVSVAEAAAGITLLTGGVAAAALAAAVAGGLAAAVAASIGQRVGHKQEFFLREQLDRGGIILWAKTHDDVAKEQAAFMLLKHHGATEVHGRAMPIDPQNN